MFHQTLTVKTVIFILALPLILPGIFAAEKCDLVLTNCPETFSGDTIIVPKKVTGISPQVYSCKSNQTIQVVQTTNANPSILFVIDNSGSMKTNPGNDATGSRFTVTKDLLDSIAIKQPNAEVGLIVFREHLYFDTTTTEYYTKYFKTLSPILDNEPTQAYLPFMTLNQTYNNKKGIDIIKDILATQKVSGTQNYTDLVYAPAYRRTTSGGETNINGAFIAAKEAFANAKNPKNQQFVIFLSDGEPAGTDQAGLDQMNFTTGTNIPTTFTIYFTSGTTAPTSLRTMTTNIKANGYSTSNPQSALWTLQTSYKSLLDLLMNNVFSNMLVSANPIQMILNGTISTTYQNSSFIFKDTFKLAENITPITMTIQYRYNLPTTGQSKDTSVIIPFFIKRSDVGTTTPGVSFICSALATSAIPVTATLLDTNHEGHLDAIELTWTDTAGFKQIMPAISQFVTTLQLTSLEGVPVSLQAVKIVPDLARKTIRLILAENQRPIFETGWLQATVTLSNIPMTLNGDPLTVSKIVDGADPVIKKVYYVPGTTKDSLIVIYSEPINWATTTINPATLFVVQQNGGQFPISNLQPLSTSKLSDRIIYELPRDVIIPSDIHIRQDTGPLVPVEYDPRAPLITNVDIRANPFTPGVTEIPIAKRDNTDPAYGAKILVTLNKPARGASLSQDVTGSVTIFDAVGNVVYQNNTMKIENQKNLYAIWDGNNQKGTRVSLGTYLARIVISDKSTGKNETKQLRIGIKK